MDCHVLIHHFNHNCYAKQMRNVQLVGQLPLSVDEYIHLSHLELHLYFCNHLENLLCNVSVS